MYRTSNFSWKLTHVLCILAHLGLIAGAAIAYVYNASKDRRAVGWASMAGLDMARMSPCSDIRLLVARQWHYAPPEALDAAALLTLPVSGMVLVSRSLLFPSSWPHSVPPHARPQRT